MTDDRLTAALIASQRTATAHGRAWGVAQAAADVIAWRRESGVEPGPIDRAQLVCGLYDAHNVRLERGEQWTVRDVHEAVTGWLSRPLHDMAVVAAGHLSTAPAVPTTTYDLAATLTAHRLAIEQARRALRMGQPAVALDVLERVEPHQVRAGT